MNPTKTHISGLRTVSIPVDDQDVALGFYVDTLGFTTLRDNPTPNGGRWIELAPGNDDVIVTLEPASPHVARGALWHPIHQRRCRSQPRPASHCRRPGKYGRCSSQRARSRNAPRSR